MSKFFRPRYESDADYTTNAPSYYDELARKNKLIEALAKKIWEYDKELAKRFAEWDKNLEDFPDDVKALLNEWIDDGTFAEIINEEIFLTKADQEDFLSFQKEMEEELNHIGVSQIDLNKGKITEQFLSETLLAQIAGTTEIYTSVEDGSITLNKLDFAEVATINLFNKDEAISGSLGSLGTVVTNTNFYTTNYIKVENIDIITTSSNIQTYSFYNQNKEHISTVSNYGQSSLNITGDAYYVRISFYYTNLNSFMVINGEQPLEYVPYRKAIDGYYVYNLDGKDINDNTVSLNKLIDGHFSKNLINNAKSTDKVYLNNGVLSPHDTLTTSDYISVTPNTNYVASIYRIVEFYDNTKQLIQVITDASLPVNKKFLTPVNAAYVRISYPIANKSNMQLEKNDVATSFEPYGKSIEGLLIKESNIIKDSVNDTQLNYLINLPSVIQSTVNKPFRIYHHSILKDYPTHFHLTYDSTIGAMYDDYFEINTNKSGTYDLTVSLYDKTTLIKSFKTSIKVNNAYSGTKNVMLIGDSFINQNIITDQLLTLGTKINLVGTLGSGNNKHEGRSGWTTGHYINDASRNLITNAFYNNGFDFKHYMTTQNITSLDSVIFNLGTNDIFNFKNDEALIAACQTFIQNFKTMINSIKAYNANIKVAINLTPSGNGSEQKFAEQKLTGQLNQNSWRYDYNTKLWVNELIKSFDKSETTLIATNAVIDNRVDIADHIHPNEIGYRKMGDAIINYLNSF